MNRTEFLNTLRQALSVLPDDERNNAMRYYEDYFLDAGDVNEAEIIAQLGDPRKIAEQILADYRELAVRGGQSGNTSTPPEPEQTQQTGTGSAGTKASGSASNVRRTSPVVVALILAAAILFGLPFGLPVAITLVVLILLLPFTLAAVVLSLLVAAVCLLAGLCLSGVLLCFFSFTLWATPASALCTLGLGLIFLSIGVLLSLLFVKVLILFVPPLFRAFVSLLRWPIDRLKGASK